MTKKNFYSFLILTLPFLYFLMLPIATGDMAVWVAHGKYFLTSGAILKHDIFSMLLTKELVYPFGITLFYAGIDKYFGLIGVSFFHKLIPIIISATFLWIMEKNKTDFNLMTIGIVFLSFFGISFFFIERPALVALMPFLYSYLILTKEELEWKDYGVLVFLNILWVNLHGSFILLPLMYFYKELIRFLNLKKMKIKNLIFGIFLLTSSFLNPFGYKIFPYILETAKVSAGRGLDEWGRTTPFGNYWLQAISFYVLLITLIYFHPRKNNWKQLLLDPLFPLTLMGIFTIRNTIWAHLALVPYLIKFSFLKKEIAYAPHQKNFLNWLLVSLIMFMIVIFSPWLKENFKRWLPIEKQNLYMESTPIVFSEEINKRFTNKNIFNDWDYGSYLTLKQKNKIFIDTRNIIYSDENFREYLEVIRGADSWEEILNKYKCEIVIVRKKNAEKLITKIAKSKNWKLVLENSDGIMFVKRA